MRAHGLSSTRVIKTIARRLPVSLNRRRICSPSTVDTADTVDTVDTADTADTVDSVDTADTVDSVDTADTVELPDLRVDGSRPIIVVPPVDGPDAAARQGPAGLADGSESPDAVAS